MYVVKDKNSFPVCELHGTFCDNSFNTYPTKSTDFF